MKFVIDLTERLSLGRLVRIDVDPDLPELPNAGTLTAISDNGNHSASATWEAIGPYTFVDVDVWANDDGSGSTGHVIASSSEDFLV